MRLRPSFEGDDADITSLDLSRIDDDPITYFLTPATPAAYEDFDDPMDFEMEFDAGIEDAKHPPPIVRSVSPSSLGGLSLPPGPPPPRLPTPPRRSVSPDTDHELPATPDDSEDYMQYAAKGRPHSFGLPFSLRDFAEGKLGVPTSGKGSETLVMPGSFDGSALDARAQAASSIPRPASRRSRPRKVTPRRSPHAWREPSPDVWSIEEETEETTTTTTTPSDNGIGDSGYVGDAIDFDKVMGIDGAVAAAKPKKRVRFVLPA